MNAVGIEFRFSPCGTETEFKVDGRYQELDESQTDLIKELDAEFKTRYPEAHKAATELYNHRPNYKYLAVHRIIKCNWGNSDEKLDIDFDGNFNFERVHCPLRGGFCPYEGIICNPKEETGLTDRETEVVQLIMKPDKEIATTLFLSVHTIENHIQNIKRKLGLNSKGEILNYAHRHNLIK